MGSRCQCHNYSGLFCLRVLRDSHKAAKAWLPAQLVGKATKAHLKPPQGHRQHETRAGGKQQDRDQQHWVVLLFLGVIQLQHGPGLIPLRKEGSPRGGVSKTSSVSAASYYTKLGNLRHKAFWRLFSPSSLCPYCRMHITPGTPERNQGRKTVWLGNLSNVNILHPGALLSGKRWTLCTQVCVDWA